MFMITLLSYFGLSCDAEVIDEQENPKVLTFVWPGDFHLTTSTASTALDLKKVILEANSIIKPNFIHLAGDNADNGTEVEYQLLKTFLGNATMPVYPMIGDHDVKSGIENWQRHFGKPYYSIDIGGYHFATLNSMDGSASRIKEGFSEEQLKWLESDLADAEKRHLSSLLFWHFYPPDKLSASWKKIQQIITKHDVLGVLTGHAHFNQITNYGNIAVITTRTILSPQDSENTGYAVISLDDGTLSWKFKELNQDFPFVMITYPANKILATDAPAVVKSDGVIRAKVFSDHKIAQSQYRINKGEWMTMSPLLDEGMWEAKFDSRNLPDGDHLLSVKVADSKGRTSTDNIVMIVNQKGTFVSSVAQYPNIIPDAKKEPNNEKKPTIVTVNDNELILSIGSVWMMTENGLQKGEIGLLSITPNGVYATAKEGLFQSRDGNFFSEVKLGNGEEVAKSFEDVTAVVTDKQGIIYVSTHHDGIFKSVDEGSTWQEISRLIAAKSDDFHAHSLVVDVKNKLYVATASGIFSTDDGGATWHDSGLANLYVKTMKIDHKSLTIYAATKEHQGSGFGAVYRLSKGKTWKKLGKDSLKKEDIQTIFVSSNKIYALTKNGLYASTGGDFLLEENISRSMKLLPQMDDR